MKLKDFIAQTISEICIGIEESGQVINIEKNKSIIAPTISFTAEEYEVESYKLMGRDIEFDIALSVSNENKENEKNILNIKVVTFNNNKNTTNKLDTVHRVKFKVPYLPAFLTKNSTGKK